MSLLSYFRAFARGRAGIVGLSIVLWLSQSVAELLPGLILKGFFDAVERSAFADADRALMVLLAFAAGFSGIVMATAVASARLRFHVSNALRRGIMNALLQREAPATSHSVGETLATARDDPMELADTVTTATDQIGIVIFTTVALVLMARIDLIITVVAMAPIVIVVIVSQLTRRKVDRYRTKSRQAAADATGFMVDALSAWKTIQLSSAQDAVTRRLARLEGERRRFAIRDQLLERSIAAAFSTTSAIGVGLVLVVAGGAIQVGDFSIGDFALFVYYLTIIAEFSAEFGGLLLHYRQAKVSWGRITTLSGSRDPRSWIETIPPFRQDQEPANSGPEPLQELRLRDLTVQATNRGGADGSLPEAVDGINLTFRPGELVAVTGRVGAGKTTLLKAMLGLIAVERGEILWNGRVVHEPGTFFRFPTCTYVSQEPRLFSVSIRENIVLDPDLNEGDELSGEIATALQAAALSRDLERLPEGAATVIGAAGAKLSGGQRQRLASARAFYHGAQVVILDDPCSALDPDTEREYLHNVKRMAGQGGALCVVSGTSKELLMAVDRIVVMREGSVEATGTLPELLNGTGEMSLLWDSLAGRE